MPRYSTSPAFFRLDLLMSRDARTVFTEVSSLVNDAQVDLNLKRDELTALVAALREALEDRELLIRRIAHVRDRGYSSVIEELHSGPLQLLSSTCQLYQQRTRTISETSEQRYQADLLIKDVIQAIDDIRRILRDSMSRMASRDATTQLREQIRKESGVTLEILPDDYALSHIPVLLGNLLRAFVEQTIVNAREHGHATAIHVTIVRTENEVILSTADNGRGFVGRGPRSIDDLQSYFDEGRLGLRTLAELARPFNGRLDIIPNSSKLGGAEVCLRLSLSHESDLQEAIRFIEP